MFKLLIFDLDGTLIDSARDIVTAVNLMFERQGKAPMPYETIVSHIGEGLKKLIYDLVPDASQEVRRRLEHEFLQIYGENLLTHTRVFPGVIEFLNSWPHHLAIVTNKMERYARQVIAGLGLDQYPWVRVYGADSLSERKPHPLPLIEVMKAARCEPHETVMIGDGTPDILAATAAGVTPLAVGFGYTFPAVLMELGALGVFNHYDELDQVLRSLPTQVVAGQAKPMS